MNEFKKNEISGTPEENKDYLRERFCSIMGQIKGKKQPQVQRYLNWLQSTDFFEAPASTKYHLSVPCGLLQHSLNVYDALMGMLEKVPEEELPDLKEDDDYYQFKVQGKQIEIFSHSTIILVSLNHDICKTNFYGSEIKNKKVYSPNGKKVDSTGRYDWVSYTGYTVNDVLPYGHGEKSAMLLQFFFNLSFEEIFSIRWHMGAYGLQGTELNAFNEACKKYPLVFLLHMADQLSGFYVEEEEKNKEGF